MILYLYFCLFYGTTMFKYLHNPAGNLKSFHCSCWQTTVCCYSSVKSFGSRNRSHRTETLFLFLFEASFQSAFTIPYLNDILRPAAPHDSSITLTITPYTPRQRFRNVRSQKQMSGTSMKTSWYITVVDGSIKALTLNVPFSWHFCKKLRN